MIITRTSPVTGKRVKKELDITPQQLALWEEGMLIQRAMPNLTADEREFLITGMSSEDWNATFPKEEE